MFGYVFEPRKVLKLGVATWTARLGYHVAHIFRIRFVDNDCVSHLIHDSLERRKPKLLVIREFKIPHDDLQPRSDPSRLIAVRVRI